MEWLHDFRYDRPGTFYTLVAAASLSIAGMGFFLLPETEFFNTVGVTTVQKRAIAGQRAVYWHARSIVHASAGDIAPTVVYGNLLGIDQDATLIASIPAGETYEERRYRLADVVVFDVQAAARMIADVRLTPAKFDVYDNAQAVVWINREPLNVRLIEEGAASPDPNPPTNIVDIAFARHYWSIFKGERQ